MFHEPVLPEVCRLRFTTGEMDQRGRQVPVFASGRSDGCRAWGAGLVGPALSALDAHIGYASGSQTRAKDARRAAQHAAAAQEARSMLGEAPAWTPSCRA